MRLKIKNKKIKNKKQKIKQKKQNRERITCTHRQDQISRSFGQAILS